MERKIGEIFEYNDEWYQAVKSQGKCYSCDLFVDGHCISDFSLNGSCFSHHRKDKEEIMFKKLKKVGEPYSDYCPTGRIIYFQRYRCYQKPIIEGNIIWHWADDTLIDIEIKQNKKDMEEEKHSNLENTGKNLKPFDLQKAKAGKPVCTRDGRKARIICFDQKDIAPIVGLVTGLDGKESIYAFYKDGRVSSQEERVDDLMMLPEKKTGWVNVYKDSVYDTKDKALIGRSGNGYIDTIKVEWEE